MNNQFLHCKSLIASPLELTDIAVHTFCISRNNSYSHIVMHRHQCVCASGCGTIEFGAPVVEYLHVEGMDANTEFRRHTQAVEQWESDNPDRFG